MWPRSYATVVVVVVVVVVIVVAVAVVAEGGGGGERLVLVLLRRTRVNRTYGVHHNLYVPLFLGTMCGPIYYGIP